MNYILLPSLKDAAAVRTASLLYNDFEIENLIDMKNGMICGWDIVEKNIVEKLSPFLPFVLQITVAKLVQPMHHEVGEWKRNHEFLLKHIGEYCCDWLIWKTDGTINRTEIAKKIIASDNIDPKVRFVLACQYFLEEEILVLWERIKIVRKRRNKLVFEDTGRIVKLWVKWLKEKKTKHWKEMIDEHLRIPYYDVSAADISVRISCYYPFLSREMRHDQIQYLGKPSTHSDDFQVCVNNMDETDRIEAFKYEYPIGLIKCISWPYRSLFMKMAKEVFSYLTFDGFRTVLNFLLFSYMLDGYEDFHLFEEFWQMSSDAFKDEVKRTQCLVNFEDYYLEVENCPRGLKEIVRKCYLD